MVRRSQAGCHALCAKEGLHFGGVHNSRFCECVSKAARLESAEASVCHDLSKKSAACGASEQATWAGRERLLRSGACE